MKNEKKAIPEKNIKRRHVNKIDDKSEKSLKGDMGEQKAIQRRRSL
jgi:hypothetical protein